MNAYDDPLEAHIERRRERRRRLVRSVRGWLRAERTPRITVALILLACLALGWLVDAGLQYVGFDFRPYRWMFAAFSTWPLFLVLLRWRARVESDRLDLVSEITQFINHDDAAEAEAADPTPSQWRQQFEEAWERESGNAVGRGSGGIFLIVILLAVSAGTWLLWDLIRLGPTLLADTMIDGDVVPAQPRLVRLVENEDWWKSLGGSTCFHFLGLAFAALVLSMFLPPDSFWVR